MTNDSESQKANDIHEVILDDGIDILLMTETWLYAQGDEACIAEMTPRGYVLRLFPRTEVLPSLFGTLSVTFLCLYIFQTPVLSVFRGRRASYLRQEVFRIGCVPVQTPFQLEELPEFFTQFAGSHSDLVLLGDFNFHYGDCADTQVNRLKTMLSDHGLTQLVDAPTHRCGHTLDWAVVCSDVSNSFVLERVDDMPGLSDHRSLLCQMTITVPSKSKRTVTSRYTKAVSLPDF